MLAEFARGGLRRSLGTRGTSGRLRGKGATFGEHGSTLDFEAVTRQTGIDLRAVGIDAAIDYATREIELRMDEHRGGA